jgi:diguanylate cyclase (GGDEF)-like protein
MAATLVLTVKGLSARLGIAARLAMSFTAVAALAVAANLIAEGKISIVHTTEVRHERVIAEVPMPKVAPAVIKPTVQPAVPVLPPNSDGMRRALDRLDQAAQNRIGDDDEDTSARFKKTSDELDRSVSAYLAAFSRTDEIPPVKLRPLVRSHHQQAQNLVLLADSRRTTLNDYSAHFEQLNTRVKQSLGHAWKIFGRVVARQSLVQLTGNLDELRRRYSAFVAAATPDSGQFEALVASESAIAKTLTDDRAGFTKSEGEKWYSQSVADVEAMSTARETLQATDQQRLAGVRAFTDQSSSIAQLLTRSTIEAASQPPSAASAIEGRPTATDTMSGRSTSSGAATASTAPSFAEPSSVTPSFAEPPKVERHVSTAVLNSDDHTRRTLVAWISCGVLSLVIYISTGTMLSIVRPVRRLLKATASIAQGDTAARVPRGGIRELDTLGLAFNDMAEQLSAAQEAARGQQHQLEAKVAERTQQLRELAEHDPLTGLVNRRHLFALLNGAIESAAAANRHVGVYFLDIDNFKNINDSMGHAFGDRVLQAIAERLAQVASKFGFAARPGGDEFAVVYDSAASIEDIREAGMLLVEAFHEPLPLEDRDLVVSVSVGASIYPDHEREVEALLRAADAALFSAKAQGRSQLAVFTPQLLAAATAKFSIEQGLRRALERGEFELAFQPEVNLETCQPALAEALLRWRLPDGRCAAPGEFLAVAEESGLIMQISDWVLHAAVEAAAGWHHGAWPAARIAINVSPRQMLDHRFVDRVQGLLEDFNLPPRCIEIELTENVLQTGPTTISALHRLRAYGVAIALDDFGTGFSSLASLDQLPLTHIKLDRSLIATIDTSVRSAAIARAIIGLCRSLGMTITAEGIERPEQLTPLLGNPSMYAQGYLFSYPVPGDELLRVLENIPALTRSLVESCGGRVTEERLADRLLLSTA